MSLEWHLKALQLNLDNTLGKATVKEEIWPPPLKSDSLELESLE